MRLKTSIISFGIVFMLLGSIAFAGGIAAITNQMGYQGSIWNITDSTGPWLTSTPRNANVYLVYGFGPGNDYNELLSSWWEHPVSNQNDSFLQLAEENSTPSITSISAGWNPAGTVFSVTVAGSNAPYPWSRFWQPDNGVAWGVTFTDYIYTFTATYASDQGGEFSSANPISIIGNFSGEFQVTYDVNKNPITNGDLYGFDIDFDSAWFDNPDDLITPESYFGVPEPSLFLLLGLGLGAVAIMSRRFKG